MRTEVRVRNESIPEIQSTDFVSVDTSDRFVTISRFRKLDDYTDFAMILLTPEETKEMARVLANSVRKFTRAGRL